MAEQIGLFQMAAAYLLLIVVLIAATINRLGVNRQTLIAAARMTAQLVLAGVALKYIFSINTWYLTLAVLVIMLGGAVHTVLGRLEDRMGGLVPILAASIGAGSAIVIFVLLMAIVTRRPWFDPRYSLPISGMIIGNAMTACVLVLERYTSEIRQGRSVVETKLSLGATYKEASVDQFRAAYRASLLPTIASMSGIGIVHLPGMMTGQILSGVDPLLAVKYQIAIILAILAAAALSSLMLLYLIRRRVFNRLHQITFGN
jgi:putative ABC transport system permease protein